MFSREILSEVARHFFAANEWNSIQPLGNGLINQTYLLDFQTDMGREQWVLQSLNTQIFTQPDVVHKNWQRIAAYLQKTDYPLEIPFLRNTTEGAPALHLSESKTVFRVQPFFKNTFAPENVANPKAAYEAAWAYGTFVKFLADFPASTLEVSLPDFHNLEKRWQQFYECLNKDTYQRVATCPSVIEKILKKQSILLTIKDLQRQNTLPLRVTHNDTKAGNVLLSNAEERAIAVIDWDTLMPGTVLTDFGDMLRTFVPNLPENAKNLEDLHLRSEILAATTQGFLEATRGVITKIEAENLFWGGLWIVSEQALRFLTDYLAGDVYYKIDYPTQNLDRTKNQLAVLEQLEAHFLR